MSNANKPLVSLGPCTHIGAQVKDVDKTIEILTKCFGWGPWGARREKQKRTAIRGGKKFNYDTTGNYCRIGNCLLDITETHGEDCRTEWVARTGGGLHHLNFNVDDVKEATEKLEKAGAEVLEIAVLDSGEYRMSYVDVGGIIIELLSKKIAPDWTR